MCHDAIPLLNLLLGAGALIHGSDLESPVQKPTHIPVFVAVEHMALTGITTLLDWCLYHGANLNHGAAVEDRDIHWTAHHATVGYYHYATPALCYVNSISSWEHCEKKEKTCDSPYVDEDCGQRTGLKLQNPLQGLINLPDRGAQIESASGYNEERRKKRQVYANKTPPWCLEHLVQRWGLAKLQECSNYSMVVEYLLHCSVQRGDIAEMLARCQFALRVSYHPRAHPPRYNAHSEETARNWVGFVDKYLLQKHQLNPTRLLAEYIVCKGRRLGALQDIGRATVDHLLAVGADINARVGDGSTPLHQHCREYNVLERDEQPVWFTRQITVKGDRLDFVRYLLSKGADASLTAQGSTARDPLLANVCEDRNSSRVYVLAQILSPEVLWPNKQ
ncbi:hypothetical protein BDW68DRAFT_156334 [Aspergillus falconensis]